jgi:hypothetical protein
MRLAGRLKLGFYPLPSPEAERLSACLDCPHPFSALDPCAGDGAAFVRLLAGKPATLHGIELDSGRAQEARAHGLHLVHGSAFEVRCAAESFSLLYLNPPYDYEAGESGNARLERRFLEHTFRWLKVKGVLVMVLPRRQLNSCARLLAEHFTDIRMFSLGDPECIRYEQIAVLARRGSRPAPDSTLLATQEALQAIAVGRSIPVLGDASRMLYPVPPSGSAVLRSQALPLDDIEDLLPRSGAYRQASRALLGGNQVFQGRPLTPLHGGHVSLLATAGMLNGVFGEGGDRHMAHWRSLKFIDRWRELAPDGATLDHERERFSHELTLVYADGRTLVLTHESQKQEREQEEDQKQERKEQRKQEKKDQ